MKISPGHSSIPDLNNLAELLQLPGVQFIDAAYECVLGRQADSAGQGYYLYRLQTGFSKMGILAQMRLSPEGIDRKLLLPGLDAGLQQYAKRRMSFWAKLGALLGLPLDDTPADRRMRAIECQLALISQALTEKQGQDHDSLIALARSTAKSNGNIVGNSVDNRMPDYDSTIPSVQLQELEPNSAVQFVSGRRKKMILDRIKNAVNNSTGREA